MSEEPSTKPGSTLGDREREGVIELLGVIAYGAISGFTRLAADSELSKDLGLKTALAGMAVDEFAKHELLVTHIRELGGDPMEAMTPFVPAFDSFHARTAPRGLLEGLVKAYIGDGIANDFFREISAFVDDESRAIIAQAAGDGRRTEVIVDAVRRQIRADRHLAGPLALWGRRLVGEALSQGQLVAGERDALAELILGTSHSRPGAGLEEMGAIMQRLTDAHQQRMARLGLSA
ncbi:ferritin-like domain-containing protein [Marihabitans asiaticum]|uniref:tRNA-(MS[2]IO[6]A)-hydroxylase MiaE-like protein n=1 Tax=Marihabitans asiaticum TaxID=415218 RepID=A0A560WI19_9MICO|nr:ferritin-like fold-containing protein [Marihabitans asiaticum]TWD17343.1 tRNA-(MS[2]IO[6]A)-hydroxylase MiaE-like protein [Marihabitans asiaticum]